MHSSDFTLFGDRMSYYKRYWVEYYIKLESNRSTGNLARWGTCHLDQRGQVAVESEVVSPPTNSFLSGLSSCSRHFRLALLLQPPLHLITEHSPGTHYQRVIAPPDTTTGDYNCDVIAHSWAHRLTTTNSQSTRYCGGHHTIITSILCDRLDDDLRFVQYEKYISAECKTCFAI